MNGSKLEVGLTGLLMTALFAGCGAPEEAPSAPSLLTSPEGAAPAEPHTLDQELSAVAAQVPGFGGLFTDSAGRVVVFLRDPPSQRARAAEFLSTFLPTATSELRGATARELIFREARYLFQDLQSWRTEFDAQWPDGTVFSDTDEHRNRLTIAVTTDAVAQAVAGILDRLRVPDSARTIVQVSPPTPGVDSLLGHVRPTTGGINIANCYSSGGTVICGNCTLGANVLKFASRAFVTNSHCSRVVFGLDNDPSAWWKQGVDTIATGEWLDPAPFSGGACPPGKICRYSDATLVQYADPADWEGAHIAQPWWDTFPPWHPFTVRMLIDQSITDYTNQVVKVGYFSGMTHGTQGNTCITVDLNTSSWAALGVPSNMRLLCQNLALNLRMRPGDSGGPVFSPSPGVCYLLCEPVYLRGLEFQFNVVNDTVYYSPISGINLDLGPFLKWDIW